MFSEYSKQQEVLFKSLQFYRLKFDLKRINHDLKSFENSTLKKTVYNDEYKKLNNLKLKKTKQIQKLEKVAIDNNYELIPEKELEKAIDDTFADDKYEIKKKSFVFRVIWDDSYSYKHKESLDTISEWFFEDTKRIGEITKSIENFYKSISKVKLTKEQKVLIGTNVVIGIATVIVGVTSASGGLKSEATGTTHNLKNIGFGDMRRAPGVIALLSPLIVSAFGGATYMVSDYCNKEETRKMVRNMNSNDIALNLSSLCFMIDELKPFLGNEELKEALNLCLLNVSEQKSEVDYLLFVERENITENKKKLEMLHRFDEQVIKILAL